MSSLTDKIKELRDQEQKEKEIKNFQETNSLSSKIKQLRGNKDLESVVKKNISKGNFITDIPKSLVRGLDITGESIGGALEMLHIPGGEYVKNLYGERAKRPEIAKPEYLQRGTVVDQPGKLADVRWWVNTIGENLPNMLVMLAPGAAAFRGAKAFGVGTKTAIKMATASSGAGAFTIESGATYNEAKDQMLKLGYSNDQANTMATIEGGIVGAVNTILELTPFHVLLKNPASRKILGRIIRQAFVEGGTEGVQESVQIIAARLGHGQNDKLKNNIGRIIEASLGGFAIGGGVATVTPHATIDVEPTIEDRNIPENILEDFSKKEIEKDLKDSKPFDETKPVPKGDLVLTRKEIKDDIKRLQKELDKAKSEGAKKSFQSAIDEATNALDALEIKGVPVETPAKKKLEDRSLKELEKAKERIEELEKGGTETPAEEIKNTKDTINKLINKKKKIEQPKMNIKDLGKRAILMPDGSVIKGRELKGPTGKDKITEKFLEETNKVKNELETSYPEGDHGYLNKKGEFISEDFAKTLLLEEDIKTIPIEELEKDLSKQKIDIPESEEIKSKFDDLTSDQKEYVKSKDKFIKKASKKFAGPSISAEDLYQGTQLELIKKARSGYKGPFKPSLHMQKMVNEARGKGIASRGRVEHGEIPATKSEIELPSLVEDLVPTKETEILTEIDKLENEGKRLGINVDLNDLSKTKDNLEEAITKLEGSDLTAAEQLHKDIYGTIVPKGLAFNKLNPREKAAYIKQLEKERKNEQIRFAKEEKERREKFRKSLEGVGPEVKVVGKGLEKRKVFIGGIKEKEVETENLKGLKPRERIVTYEGIKTGKNKGNGYKSKGVALNSLKRKKIKDPKKYSNAFVTQQTTPNGPWYIAVQTPEQTTERIVPLKSEKSKPRKAKIRVTPDLAIKRNEIELERRRQLEQEQDRIVRELKRGKSTDKIISTIEKTKSEKKRDRLHKIVQNIVENERGSTPELTGLAKSMVDATQSMYDWIDIEAPWKRVGAHSTAKALKNFFSTKTRHQIDGVQEAKNLVKVFKENIPKPTQQDWVDIVLGYEDDRYFNSLSKEQQTKLQPAIKAFGDFFTEAEAILKARGLTFNWKKRIEDMLVDKARQAETQGEQQKYIDQLEDLKHINYVHIPIRVLFMQSLQDYASVRGNKIKNAQAKAILSMLTTNKREALSLNKILDREKNSDKKQMLKERIDPVSIMLAYQTKFSKDMALLDLRDALRADGYLVRMGEKKPKGPQWQEAGSMYGVLTGNWVDKKALDMLDNLLTVSEKQTPYEKSMALIKMSAFYNPVFLPMYDVIQSSMSAAPITGGILNVPKNLGKAFKYTLSNSVEYKEAMTLGVFSKPFDFPFEQYLNKIERIKKAGHIGGIKGWAISNSLDFAQRTKSIKSGSFLGALYNASWNTAWRLDETARMFTYLQLRRNHTKANAAEIAALFHGDYASVPPKTRKKLNKLFFTPTFKLVMGKLYGRMITSALKTPIKLVSGTSTKMEQQFAVGAASVAAITIGFDLMMKHYGYEPEDNEWWNYGRRYIKTTYTNEGPQEIVYIWSNPANMIQRYAQRTTKAKKDFSRSGPLKAAMTILKYDLHPAFRTLMALNENRTPSGEPIWNENDDPLEIWLRSSKFAVNDLIRITETTNTVFEKVGLGPEIKSRSERLMKNKVLLNTVLDKIFTGPLPLASAYMRQPKLRRKLGRITQMNNQFKKDQKEYVRQHGKLNEEWLKNYREKLQKEIKNE